MAATQWRPAVNALTKPVSYRIQIIPRNIAGYEEMAADISSANPVYNADLVRSLAPLIMALTVSNMGHPNPPETGILTGSAAAPHVVISGGSVSADERLRIQVIQDLVEERLLFSLIDMKEKGAGGAEIPVTQNGTYSLPGFAGSAVSSLEITVNNYAALWEMIRNNYNGRLVDVLDVRV